ncbi:MAG: hypothetical protein WAX45_04675, partial [Trichococcus flocculiformis]
MLFTFSKRLFQQPQLVLAGNTVVTTVVFPFQTAFGGESPGDLTLFCPPPRFWRVIMEHDFNFKTEEAAST